MDLVLHAIHQPIPYTPFRYQWFETYFPELFEYVNLLLYDLQDYGRFCSFCCFPANPVDLNLSLIFVWHFPSYMLYYTTINRSEDGEYLQLRRTF